MPRNPTAEEQFRSRAKKALSAGKDFQARSVHNKAILAEIKAEIEAGHKELELTTSRCKRKLSAATDAGITAIRSEVESGMRRLQRKSRPSGTASTEPLALVPVSAPSARKLTLSLWAGARLALRAPKPLPTPLPTPKPFVFDTAWTELHKANVVEAAKRYAALHGMTLGVVANWFEDGVSWYFRQAGFREELEAQTEQARRSAEEIFAPQRKKCRDCRRFGHGRYWSALGCAIHSSILDPRVSLGVEAQLRDKYLIDAATFAVEREETHTRQRAERLHLWELRQVEERREAEKYSSVGIAAAKAITEECRACGPCNELDWMMGTRCDAHERRHAEVCASMMASQLRLCP
jgi:hypothetical protein